jgi:hypothetical protein
MARKRGLTVPLRILTNGVPSLLLILAGLGIASTRPASPPSPVASTSDSAGSGALTPLRGARLLDTRLASGALHSGEVRLLQVSGRGGVPAAGAESVVLTSTAGYVSVYPGGARNPGTSTVNFVAGQTVSNTTIVSLSGAGQVSLRAAAGSVHLVVDVTGWYSTGDEPIAGGFVPVGGVRLIDTRATGTPLRGTSPLSIAVTGANEVPDAATAAVVNITGISANTSAALTAWPAGATRPVASVLNLVPHSVIADLALVKLGTNGALSIAATGGLVDLVVDLVGYINGGLPGTAAGGTTPLTPRRLLDTRSSGTGRPIGPGGSIEVLPSNSGTVPRSGVVAVVLTVTSESSTVSGGYVTVWPAGTSRPVSSSLNPRTDRPVAVTVVVALGADGGVMLYNGAGSTHLIVDITGYVVA